MFWTFEKRTVANDVQSGGFGDARSRVCWIKIELIAAIGAQMAITAKQFAVIKRRDLVERQHKVLPLWNYTLVPARPKM